MATDQDGEPQVGDPSPDAETAATPGAILHRERLRRDLSEKQVADRLHITMHYVRSVESDRYDKLPGAVFAKGYIKSYAELLGLDGSELAADYERLVNNREARREEKHRIRSERRRARNLPWVYASLIGFAGVFGILGLINNGGDPGVSTEQTQGAAQRNAPAGNPPATVAGPVGAAGEPAREDIPVASLPTGTAAWSGAAPVAGGLEQRPGSRVIEVGGSGDDVLRISFSGESWIEVNDRGSDPVYRDIREAGDVLEIHGTAPFDILLGDAPLIRLSLNGAEIDVSGDIRIDNSARLTVGL